LALLPLENNMQATILGEFDETRAGHALEYWDCRGCTVDFRGDLKIDPSAQFAWNVHIYTATHAIDSDHITGFTVRRVCVGPTVWIASDVILYNCIIGAGSVVSVGSVVANRIVPPDCVVEGNPAMIVAVREGDKFVSLQEPFPLERIRS
jgi:acetyltransferase-like isoleucine patch superfamily enzyme